MNVSSTILIVDDEPVGRKTLKALLHNQGFQLDFASSGPEALAQAAALQPDVILLDVMMPEMDGFEVCRRLRATPQLAEVPVVMVTALDDQDSRLRGLEAGADEFISKPFNRAELRARLQTITSLNRYRRLHAERARFEWVVEHADDGYLIIDQHDQILYANPQARSHLNLPNGGKAVSETFLALALAHYQLEPEEAWLNWPYPPAGDRFMVQPASPMSEAFWLAVELLPIQTDVEGARAIRLRNVTDSVREQRLVWSFHGQLSHKLKTPLALLDGFIDFLADGLTDLPLAEQEYLITNARANANQLRRQILNIFDYLDSQDVARLASGYCHSDEVPAIIRDTASSTGVNLRQLVSGITSTAIIPLSAQVIELILRELFQNAQNFHPQRSANVDIILSSTSEQLCIQVADDGQTLAADQLARLWTPYYQAERNFSGQLPGMGLGLSTVASYVWNVGGSCRAFNRAAEPGIVVELLIPLVKNDLPAPDSIAVSAGTA